MRNNFLEIFRSFYKINVLKRFKLVMADKQDEANHEENNAETSKAKSASSPGSSASSLPFQIETLRLFLAEKLGVRDFQNYEKEPVLDNVSIDGIVDYIKKGLGRNIITMAGAGISTSAGIPDFRSPNSGLYNNLQKYNLPYPQAIFELSFFRDNPKPFFVLAKELYPGSFKPTISHYFIKLLENKNYLLRHYTQNIDTLERVAGISGDKLVEAHGTFHLGHCTECNHEYSLEWMKERIFKDEIPICKKCPGVVKPDIVFFGENLPKKFHKCMEVDFPKCDLLIILGSSLVVQPFASLVDRVSDRVPRLLINREKAGDNSGFMVFMGLGGGLDFDSENNTRDVLWLGECDEGCTLLADKLGWGDELRDLVKREHKRIDEEEAKQKIKSKEEKPESKVKESEVESPQNKEHEHAAGADCGKPELNIEKSETKLEESKIKAEDVPSKEQKETVVSEGSVPEKQHP